MYQFIMKVQFQKYDHHNPVLYVFFCVLQMVRQLDNPAVFNHFRIMRLIKKDTTINGRRHPSFRSLSTNTLTQQIIFSTATEHTVNLFKLNLPEGNLQHCLQACLQKKVTEIQLIYEWFVYLQLVDKQLQNDMGYKLDS